MFTQYAAQSTSDVLLTDLLAPDRIKVPILGRDKPAVLSEMLGLLVGPGTPEFLDILRAVEERERVLSTGIGHGVAIPHCKSQQIQELRIAAGASSAPVAFDALDGQPVRLFFLLIGPEATAGEEVKALGRISRLVRRAPVREGLLACRDAGAFYRFLCEAERQVA
jgi:mannitol/fructose-specific phosphotransferase system IIA component (Ntr-type)